MSDEPKIEQYWSSTYKRLYPKHQPELVEKAVRMANFQEARGAQVFLAKPLDIEAVQIHPGQRVWFCRALQALTRDEVIKLHDHLIAGAIACNETGGDFTAPDVRALLPHIYGDTAEAHD